MSATIPETMLLSDLLKPTGYDCPENLQGKTFTESTSGGGGDITVEALSVTENGTYTASSGKAYSPVTVNVPSTGTTAYCWAVSEGDYMYTTYAVAPTDEETFLTSLQFRNLPPDIKPQGDFSIEEFETRVSDTKFTTSVRGETYNTYERYPAGDFTLWEES